MPRNSSQWVTHRINGGWATDYGRTFYGSPEGGSFEIPWCNTCENVRFNPDGSFGKYPGLDSFLDAPIKAPGGANGFTESSYIRQLYSYVRMGSTLTGTREEMVVIGSYLYTITSSILTQIGDLSSSSPALHQMSTFNDLLIIGTGGSPKSWDQTTFQLLAGAPPTFEFSTPHAGRHWAAGVSSDPYRLYYSAVGNPEDWVGAGSGSIDIDPGDGDAIVGLLSWKRELWVFKGPNRLSIHRITGSSPSDFARVPFTYGVSAAGQQSIFPVGDDFAFWSPRGSCHSLTATDSYGDYTQAYLNFPILSWCRNSGNLSGGVAGYYWQTVTDFSQNITYCALNNGFVYDSSNPSVILAMDWRFRTDSNPYPRFTQLNFNRKITALGLLAGRIEEAQLLPTFGDKDGWILQESSPNAPSFTIDASPLSYTIETPGLTYGPSVETKTVMAVSVDVVSNYNVLNSAYGSLDLSYGGPGAPTQTLTFDTRNGIGLGTFVLGTDQLADGNETPGFAENINGDSRAFAYTLVENSGVSGSRGNDVRVKHFSVQLIPTGESLENT
ncbi:MAG: hypothetical protein ABL983_01090 [Nitrospira sp.]